MKICKTLDFPDKKYNIIYADPPWAYGNFSNTKDTRNFDHDKGCFDSKYGITPYNTMPLNDLKKLGIFNLAEKE